MSATEMIEIETRRKAIRLPLRELAPLVPCGHNAVAAALKGKSSPHAVTRQAIEQAVSGEERRLRDYLLGLHPLAQGAGAAT